MRPMIKYLYMKKILLCSILVLVSHILISQVQNSSLTNTNGSCPPAGWTKEGVFGCASVEILPAWGNAPFVLPPSVVVPNAKPGDRIW